MVVAGQRQVLEPRRRKSPRIQRCSIARAVHNMGAFGYGNHERELTLAMAVRTLTVREGEGHYFAGAGIVADSDPRLELHETAWKALQLLTSTHPPRAARGEPCSLQRPRRR